ncbi:MAG: hypothetical protein HY332_02990 [Chloroflexi bacterium]|nr:hypothetical protein [Chloroflexota bacterium]
MERDKAKDIPSPAENRSWCDAPLRRITHPPAHHYFGYYDKSCWDGGGRYVLCLQSDFVERPPAAGDTATIGIVDLVNAGRFRPIAQTRAWNWQQGCMLHWMPVPHATGHVASRLRSERRVAATPTLIYNDRLDPGEQPERATPRGWDDFDGRTARFVAVVRDADTGAVVRTLPRPIYALSRDGAQAVTLNFSRLQHQRPGYGYAGIPDPWEAVPEPADDGIYWMDVVTGEHRLVIPIAQVAQLERDERFDGKIHRFNHLQFSPDDGRFVFLHRWQTHVGGERFHRMLTARPDGSDVAIVASHGVVSHFDWRDPDHVLAWAYNRGTGNRYLVFRDRVTDEVEVLGEGVLTQDGHCSYSVDGMWLLTDTYPRTDHPYRTLILYDLLSGRRIDVGAFYSPPEITGEIRCDLHPRWNRDGTQICFDSVHEGHRQLYVADVSPLIDR